MNTVVRFLLFLSPLSGVVALLFFVSSPIAVAAPKPDAYWQVDDVRQIISGKPLSKPAHPGKRIALAVGTIVGIKGHVASLAGKRTPRPK